MFGPQIIYFPEVEHPHLAKVYDLGIITEVKGIDELKVGSAFYTQDLVEGTPANEWARTLSLEDRTWEIAYNVRRKQKMEQVIDQAQALVEQLGDSKSSTAAGLGDALAVLKLHAEAFGGIQMESEINATSSSSLLPICTLLPGSTTTTPWSVTTNPGLFMNP